MYLQFSAVMRPWTERVIDIQTPRKSHCLPLNCRAYNGSAFPGEISATLIRLYDIVYQREGFLTPNFYIAPTKLWQFRGDLMKRAGLFPPYCETRVIIESSEVTIVKEQRTVKFWVAGIPRLTIKIAADHCRGLLSAGISRGGQCRAFPLTLPSTSGER